MAAYRQWFHRTLQQPYTIEQMTAMLELYLISHFRYYSNLPGQVREKQQRIFKIQRRLEAEHFLRTEEFKVRLAMTVDKVSLLRGEIVRYEHPFSYDLKGIYHKVSEEKKGFEMKIPTAISTLSESDRPYFEFFFDDNLEPYTPELYEFFSDVYYLQFLRRELATIEASEKDERHKEKPSPPFHSFEQLFKVPEDFQKVIAYLKSIDILDDEGKVIEASGRKKYLAVLIEVLRKKSKIKPVTDEDAASLMRKEFGAPSFSSTYMGKYFSGREELIEEIMRDLRL